MSRKKYQLTGVSKRTINAIERKLGIVADILERHNLVLFSGNCVNAAIILHLPTGILLGEPRGGVWYGGDLNIRYDCDPPYGPELSSTAGEFRNKTRKITESDLSREP